MMYQSDMALQMVIKEELGSAILTDHITLRGFIQLFCLCKRFFLFVHTTEPVIPGKQSATRNPSGFPKAGDRMIFAKTAKKIQSPQFEEKLISLPAFFCILLTHPGMGQGQVVAGAGGEKHLEDMHIAMPE
ncbi:MAG: hypothetical protein KKC76_14775 [Proteobacteria bacterium]|nr:hypothetical protein [Pseudomonadota bacterium]MBU4294321.1 hypothetical protein [Pseudomonadota bacterium]MCG2749108.1 hypothetical protein [Desulfobulbaceae bacterium]